MIFGQILFNLHKFHRKKQNPFRSSHILKLNSFLLKMKRNSFLRVMVAILDGRWILRVMVAILDGRWIIKYLSEIESIKDYPIHFKFNLSQ